MLVTRHVSEIFLVRALSLQPFHHPSTQLNNVMRHVCMLLRYGGDWRACS
jgi:hypothetical protein